MHFKSVRTMRQVCACVCVCYNVCVACASLGVLVYLCVYCVRGRKRVDEREERNVKERLCVGGLTSFVTSLHAAVKAASD